MSFILEDRATFSNEAKHLIVSILIVIPYIFSYNLSRFTPPSISKTLFPSHRSFPKILFQMTKTSFYPNLSFQRKLTTTLEENSRI